MSGLLRVERIRLDYNVWYSAAQHSTAAGHKTAVHSAAQKIGITVELHSTGQNNTGEDSTAQQDSTAPRSIRTAQHSAAQRSAAQHSTAQHSTAQHITAQHSTAQHSTAQHGTAQDGTAQDSTSHHSVAQHSTHLNIPCKANHLVSQPLALFYVRWPTGSFIALKLGLWLLAILLGLLIGKYVIHKWIFCDKLKLRIFTEDGQGSWMVMFMTTVMSLYIFSFIYNGFLMLEGQYMDRLHASPFMRMQNQTFMKFAALGTWLGDFLTAWMVTDMMLQVIEF